MAGEDELFKNACGCCGANKENENVHHQFCLINLPQCTADTIFWYKQGVKEYSDSRVATPAHDASNPNIVAYHMGRKFARSRENSERTLTSLNQAVGIMKDRLRPAV